MLILALDLGKHKSVACLYQSETGEHTFRKLATTPQVLHDLLVEVEPARVVFEAGASAGWLADLCRALGLEFQVANANHEAWRWKNVKSKTDRKDAVKLAQLSLMQQLPTVHIPEKAVRQWRALIGYRQSLVERRTMIKNHLRSILDREGLTWPTGKSGWTNLQLKELATLGRPLKECGPEELWRGEIEQELRQLGQVQERIAEVVAKLDALAAADRRVELLQTAGGVGPRLAEALVATIDNPHRFQTGKQVGCYVGLTPRQFQSGQMDRQGRISKQGNRLLRALLIEVSWAALRWNEWAKATFQRLSGGNPKNRSKAIVALARRLLVRCWAMLRDGTAWREQPPGAALATP